MRTDAVIRNEGMDALVDKLGMVDAERFITLVLKEPFDYTEWRQTGLHDEGISLEELSRKAMDEMAEA